MKPYKSILILIIFSIVLSLCACTNENIQNTSKDENISENTNSEIYKNGFTFQDSPGNKITLYKKPQNVAVLFSSFSQMWNLSSGETKITVGESVERGFATKEAILVDSGAGKTINREVLISSKPDFVIGSADIASHVELSSFLKSQNIPYSLFRVDSFDDYSYAMDIFCKINQSPESFEKYVSSQEKQIENTLKDISKSPKILFIRCGSSYGATKAKTAKDNFVCKMLEELGAVNIADSLPQLADGLSDEAILLSNPDYIFFSTMGDENKAREYMESVMDSPAWQSLDAVQKGNYTFLPKDMFQYKPNDRWSEAYTYLKNCLYNN